MNKDKYEFFYKPTTKKETVGDREITPATKYNLAEKVRALTEDQAIILNYTQEQEQRLVPDKYSGSENFLKHGKKVLIDASRPMWISREEKFSEIGERKGIDKKYFADYSGITWKPSRGSVDERSRIVHLVDCMKAVRIFNYVANNLEEVEFVHEARPKNKGPVEGANYSINLPSRSESKRAKVGVNLRHVPYTRKGDHSRVAASLEGTCDCEYNRFHNLVYQDESTGRKSPLFMDMHTIAAYLFMVDKEQKGLNNFLKEKGKNNKVCVAMVDNPFPLPTQQTLTDYIKLENQVIVKDYSRDEDGRIIMRKDKKGPRTKHRKLNRSEKELFLFNYIATYGADKFFATKKLRSYKI